MSYNQIVNLAQDINSQALSSSIRTPQNEVQKSSMRDFVVEKQIGKTSEALILLRPQVMARTAKCFSLRGKATTQSMR